MSGVSSTSSGSAEPEGEAPSDVIEAKEGGGAAARLRRVRVFINPRSGLFSSFADVQSAFERFWDDPEVDLTYQFSNRAEDGVAKVKRAVAEENYEVAAGLKNELDALREKMSRRDPAASREE